MTLKDYEQLLVCVTYKPGWRIVLRPAPAGFAYIEVNAPVYDSAPPTRSMSISISYAFGLNDFANLRKFYAFVRCCIAWTERHEFNEWFRVDGRPWPTEDHETF